MEQNAPVLTCDHCKSGPSQPLATISTEIKKTEATVINTLLKESPELCQESVDNGHHRLGMKLLGIVAECKFAWKFSDFHPSQSRGDKPSNANYC